MPILPKDRNFAPEKHICIKYAAYSIQSYNFKPYTMIKKITLISLLLTGGFTVSHAQQRTEASQPLSIEQLFHLIETNSTSLRKQKSGVEAAQLGIESAKSKRLPDLNVSLSLSYIGNALLTDRDFTNVHGLSSPHLGNDFSLQAQQAVYTGGALSSGIRIAELGKEIAQTGVTLTRQQIRFIAIGQYLDLFKVDNRIQVYNKNIELTQKLIADIKEKQSQGMALKNDITRYELQMESLKLGLTSLRNNRDILNHQLCNTLGLSTDTYIQPDTTLTNLTYGKDGEAHWQSQGSSLSPRLQLSNLNIQMAQQKERLAKSNMLPKVALVASNNFNGPILFELPPIDKNLNVWYVGVGVKYDLSSLFKSNKRIKQARIETRQSQEAKAEESEQLNNDIQAAYVQYLQTYVELETQQKSVELAQQNYDVINNRYLNQLALITDMIDASNIRLNAELQEVDARINIVYAYYRMQFVAGEI